MTEQEREERCEKRRKDIYDKLNAIKEKMVAPLRDRISKLEGKFIILCAFTAIIVAALFANMNIHMSSLQRQLDKMESRWEKVMRKVEAKQKNDNKVASRW